MKHYHYRKYGFTLVELVVVITIIAILSTVWFYNYTQHLDSARDGVRNTDISSLQSALSLYQKQRWVYPFPGNKFEIQNGSYVVAYQGKMDTSVALSTAESVPLDPKIKVPYTYATSTNRKEYELAATLEASGQPKALLKWTYKSVAKNTLPTITLAATANIDISTGTNADFFIFNESIHNLPYDFSSWEPYSDGTSFIQLISQAEGGFWQSSDFQSCHEIYLANKNISNNGTDTYQIRDTNGNLVNQDCSCTATDCTESP